MPNRILKESICSSETIEALNPEAETFFYRLLVNCDDYGRMDARPAILRAKCYPLRLDRVKESDVSNWLGALVAVGLVEIYEADGRHYLHVVTWEQHQQVRAKRSKYPAPEIICNHMISDASICPRNPNPYPNPYPNPNTDAETLTPPAGGSTPTVEPAEECLCGVPDIPETPKKPVEPQQKYGEFQNVRLTAAEHEKLVARFGAQGATDWVEELSLAKASKGYKSKSDYATILAWERRRARLDGTGPATMTGGNNGRANATSGKSIPGGSRALPRREDYESPEEYRARYQREHPTPVETPPGGHPALPGV